MINGVRREQFEVWRKLEESGECQRYKLLLAVVCTLLSLNMFMCDVVVVYGATGSVVMRGWCGLFTLLSDLSR